MTSRSSNFNINGDGIADARAASPLPVSIVDVHLSRIQAISMVETNNLFHSQISNEITVSSSANTQTHTSRTNLTARATMATSVSSSKTILSTTILPKTTITSPIASPTSHPKGLSGGAKAGISVGVTLSVLLLISLMVLAFWIGRRSTRLDVAGDSNEKGHNVNDMEQRDDAPRWPGWGKTASTQGSTGSRNSLLKNGDGRSSRIGTMMTDGRSSRMDTATLTDGRSSRMDTMTLTDGRESRMEAISPTSDQKTSQIDTDGRTSRISVHTDGRTSRIGRFEFENSTDSRGFSGGIRIVDMEDFKI